jgi:transcription termination factor Rho
MVVKKNDSAEVVDSPIDVSSMIEGIEEKPIVVKEEKPVVPTPTYRSRQEVPLEERLKEDLKISYEAKGVLDITFGGYGFLRQDYVLSPDKDIYVSTSQIRRFWLRRGDEVEGLARPPKEGERFHSLLLIKKN